MHKRSAMIIAFLVFFAAVVSGQQAQEIKCGVAAVVTPGETLKTYSQMFQYIRDKAGTKMSIVPKENNSELNGLVERSGVNCAFVSPETYIKYRDKSGFELLVVPRINAAAFDHAYIIVPKTSKAAKFADLKGKKVAFTTPESVTGKLITSYIVARRFKKAPEQFFGEIVYTKSHEKSIEAVGKGMVDAASVDSLIYEYMMKKNPVLLANTKILERSDPYAVPPVIVKKDLDPVVKEALRNTFLNMHSDPKGKEILDALMIEKFAIAKDVEYNPIREMQDFVSQF